MRPSPGAAVPAAILVAAIPPAIRAMGMQHGDDHTAARVDDQNHTFHALTIGGWDPVTQAVEMPAADHERSAAAAHERTAIGIGENRFNDANRDAA
jgi:hypothetical protein